MKRKNKKLTRLILAALMSAGGVHLASPGVVSAELTGQPITANTTIDTDISDSKFMLLQASNIALTIASNGGVNAIRTNDKNFTGNTIRVQGKVTAGDSCIYGGMKDMKVYIEDGATVNGNIYAGNNGAAATNAQDATNNLLDISGGTVGDSADNLVGGVTYGSGNATKNTVNISGGAVGGKVMGGWAYENATGDASENTVNISGGTIGNAGNATPIIIAGGVASTKADKNTVNISGGTIIAEVYGGSGKTGASGNTINIEKNAIISGGEIPTIIYGGYSSNGAATGNTVNISGGTVTASITGGNGKTGASGNTINITGSPNLENALLYGGMAQSGADNNTINIFVPVTVAHLLGGENMDLTKTSGNTLNIAAKGVSTGALYAFQNINFFLPTDMTKDDVMLNVSGDASVTDAKVGVLAQGKLANLTTNDKVTLLHASNPLNGTVSQTTEITVPESLTQAKDYEFNVTSDTNNIYATITKAPTEEKEEEKKSEEEGGGSSTGGVSDNNILKSPVEARAATVSLLNAGADMLASQGFAQAANAVALEAAESAKNGAAGAQAVGGFTPFAAFGGSSMRAESGSHVDTKGYGINVGFAREIPNSQGKLLFGPVVEYGGGKYDSYNNDVHADGNSRYWGIGIMARQVNRDGFYYEGSVRGGRVTSDYSANLPTNVRASYDSASNYWAAHLGLGKVFAAGKKGTVDGYLKYFYSHQSGDDRDINLGANGGTTSEHASFDSVDSNRVRIGARYTHKVNEMNSFYGGLAYQYEFGGEARAHYSTSGVAPSPSVKGSSGMLELGWQVKPGGPVTLDLGVTGWVGKQRGGSVQLGATWSF